MSTVIGTVTINKNPAYGTSWHDERVNQTMVITADAGHVTYDNGPAIQKGLLVLLNVVRSEGDSLRTYLTGTAIFQKTSFSIDPPANVDLGAGDGTAVTVYLNNGPTLEGVFEYIEPGMYNIRIPFWRKP